MTNLEGQRMERTYLLGNLVSSETRFDGSAVSYSYDSNANIASDDNVPDTLSSETLISADASGYVEIGVNLSR